MRHQGWSLTHLALTTGCSAAEPGAVRNHTGLCWLIKGAVHWVGRSGGSADLRHLKLWHPLGTHRQVSNCRRKFVRQQWKMGMALRLRSRKRCVNNESITMPWVKSICLKDTSRPFEEVWMILCNEHNLNVKISRWLECIRPNGGLCIFIRTHARQLMRST